MLNPKVSIILPNFNSHSYISETLDSIINQKYKNWELIVVDDNSNEKTKIILNDYLNTKNIKIIFLEKRMGAGFCRNLAIRHSISDYTAFIDSDDLWSDSKLEDQINFMRKNQYDFTYTYYSTFQEKNLNKNIRIIMPPLKFNFDDFTKNTSIATSTMILKSEIAKKFKFTKTKICEDYFYKCKALKETKYAYCLNKSLTNYRISRNSLQSNKFRNIYWIWNINKKYNGFNIFKNFISIISISLNSIKKYGFK